MAPSGASAGSVKLSWVPSLLTAKSVSSTLAPASPKMTAWIRLSVVPLMVTVLPALTLNTLSALSVVGSPTVKAFSLVIIW